MKKKTIRKTTIVMTVFGLLLSACGGGGGGGGGGGRSEAEPPAPPEYVATAYSTTDTPIATLFADPAVVAILQDYPFLLSMGASPQTAAQPIKFLQSYAFTMLSDDLLAEVDNKLAVLKPLPDAKLLSDTNVNELRVRPYVLPDPFVFLNGGKVTGANAWWEKRRPEILVLFETEKYGKAPGKPAAQRFEVIESNQPAFGGKALRKIVNIHVAYEPAAPVIQLVEYTPASKAGQKAPMMLRIGGSQAVSTFIDGANTPIPEASKWDPILQQRAIVPATPPAPGSAWDITPFLDAGFGISYYWLGGVDTDSNDGYFEGVRAFYDSSVNNETRAPDVWGAIGAWAWSTSRIMDYLATDPDVDALRISLHGDSRYGKTVLWAAAQDQRFAAVTTCCSGEGGAALSNRNFGETVANLTQNFPYHYARNFAKYANNEAELPADAHMLLALIAPRPVMLQTGRYDHAADPKGEFLAAVAATPVYELLGKQGLGALDWPPSGTLLSDIGYHMNNSGHGANDWQVHLDFLNKHVNP
ncbi:hypothetical protein AGMMS50256_02740 [Betaproteobacteria bacterium]|nr:hypothetical protein AGMMS50256_02740 [Betaproteobacteria bacterium]